MRWALFNSSALLVGILAAVLLDSSICGSAPANSPANGGAPAELDASGALSGPFNNASGDCGSVMGKIGSQDVTIFFANDGGVGLQVGQDNYVGAKVATFSGTGKNEVATLDGTVVDQKTGKTIKLKGVLNCGALK